MTILDLYYEMMKAAGAGDSPEVKDFIAKNTDMRAEVTAENAHEVFQRYFMTMEQAIGNEAVKLKLREQIYDDVSGTAHGKTMEAIEKQAQADLVAAGAWDETTGILLREAKGAEGKMAFVAERLKKHLETTGGKTDDKKTAELQAAIEQYKVDLANAKAAKDREIEEAVAPWKTKATELETGMTRFKLMQAAKGQFQFADPAVADLALPAVIDGTILNKYHIKEENGTIALYDKANPEHLATDRHGQPLKLSEVLEVSIPESLLKRQNSGGGNGIRVTGEPGPGSGAPDVSKMSPTQRRAYEVAKSQADQFKA